MPGRRTLSVLVVVGLLVATAVAGAAAYRAEREQADRENAAEARIAASAVRQSVLVAAAALRGSNALVSADGDLSSRRFRTFAAEAATQTALPGLAWARFIEGEAAEVERQIGRSMKQLAPGGGFTRYRRDADRHLVILLTYPASETRVDSLGFDVLSDPARRSVIRTAVARRRPVITGPMSLALTRQEGVILYHPVRRAGSGEVAGILLSGIPGNSIARSVRGQFGVEAEITVKDESSRVVGPPPGVDDPVQSINVLGREWRVSIPPQSGVDVGAIVAFTIGGIMLAVLAAALFGISEYRERDLVKRQKDSELKGARESLLTRISEAIEQEIEGDARLASLARTTVPAVGDVCVVHEVTATGAVRQVGVAAPDERMAELIRSTPEVPSTSPIRAAIASREPVLYTRVADNREAERARSRGITPRSKTADPERSPEAAMMADLRSSLIVPLVARGRVLGTMSLSVLASTGRPPLTREDLAFATEVASHAAVALDNARLYEQQRDIAGILQEALLPRSLPEVTGAEVAVRHLAGMVGTEVGGDFYDLFAVGDHWIAVVGDVCGKGPEAAALTALVRHTLRATAEGGAEEAVRRVHEAIYRSGEHTYCTLCCAELRPGPDGIGARVVCAGHPEPRLVTATGQVQRLEVTGPLVGALDNPTFRSQEVMIGHGSVLFMCSDGVPEARRNGEVFGDHRLEALLSAMVSDEPSAMLERLEEEVLRFAHGRPRDDLALFALRANSRRPS